MSEHSSEGLSKKWYKITESYPVNPTDENVFNALGAQKYGGPSKALIVGSVRFPKAQRYILRLSDDEYIIAKLSLSNNISIDTLSVQEFLSLVDCGFIGVDV